MADCTHAVGGQYVKERQFRDGREATRYKRAVGTVACYGRAKGVTRKPHAFRGLRSGMLKTCYWEI